MNKHVRLLFAVTLIAVVMMAGCQPAAEPTATPAPTKTPVPPTKAPEPTDTPVPAGPPSGGRVVLAHRQEPDRFWGPITGLSVSREVGGLMNHSLLVVNDELEYIPVLATEVPSAQNGGISGDSLTWTFHLRDDVKWHDGEPFTSADVKFTYEVIVDTENDVTTRVGWDRITSCECRPQNSLPLTGSGLLWGPAHSCSRSGWLATTSP